MILLREHKNINFFYFVSDRDSMTGYTGNSSLFYRLYHIYSFCISNHYVKNDNCNELLATVENEKFDFDEFIRIPDFICGTLASFDYKNNPHKKLDDKNKHDLMLQKVICSNDNIIHIIIKECDEGISTHKLKLDLEVIEIED